MGYFHDAYDVYDVTMLMLRYDIYTVNDLDRSVTRVLVQRYPGRAYRFAYDSAWTWERFVYAAQKRVGPASGEPEPQYRCRNLC